MTDQEKIQKLELSTVTAVAELKADIKNLTTMVERLDATLTRMSENYATKEELASAIRERNQAILAVSNEVKSTAKSSSRNRLINTLLWSIFSAVAMFAVMYIIEDLTKGK